MAPGGGRTDWDSHSIADIIAKLQSMDSAQAAADAAALMTAVSSAQAVARRLSSVFGGTEWVLKGNAATAGMTSSRAVGSDITSSAAAASSTISALSSAGNTLNMAKASEITLSVLQAQMIAEPENAAAIRSSVTSLMNAHYSDPMSGTAVPAAAGNDGGRATSPSGGPGGATTPPNSTQQSPDSVTPSTPGTSTPTSAPANRVAPSTRTTTTPSSTTSRPNSPTTTTAGQQNSTQQPTNTPTSTTGDKGQRTTPVPVSTTPARMTADKPLNLTRGATPSSRSPGGASPTPRTASPVTPLRRVGISSINPTGTPPGTAGSPSSSSRSATPPYGPQAGRGRSGQDGKHKAAPFLNTAQHGEEVVGSLPLVGPPVIGDWAGPPTDPADPDDARTGEK